MSSSACTGEEYTSRRRAAGIHEGFEPLQFVPLPTNMAASELPPTFFDHTLEYTSIYPVRESYRDIPRELPFFHVFNADPRLLAFGNFLNIACHFSDEAIFYHVNAMRPKKVFCSMWGVQERLRDAISWSADERANGGRSQKSGSDGEAEVWAWLEGARKQNGVKTGNERKRSAADTVIVWKEMKEARKIITANHRAKTAKKEDGVKKPAASQRRTRVKT